ncbi:MAG: terpene cyclase/mutase family protein [Pirellulaceae bacterium]|nr:terpene cyclase/mutase family protein [Pirellulaceae bacterium]
MVEPTAVEVPMDLAVVPIEMTDFASEMAPAAAQLQSLSAATSKPMGSRSADMKKKLLREYGGTESSEAAVQEALKWFARHQLPNGAWTLQHNLVCRNSCGNPCKAENRAKQINAATCLALLPYMGAGQTHMEGEFEKVVFRGLQFLIQNGKPGKVGGLPVIDYRGPGGNMYDHGLAAIVLCEAYAMTGDPAIAGPAQAAVNFIVTAQCRDGGWRYSPRQKDGGDTSVVGWQVMALKSAYMGHLAVPPASVQGSMLFLDKVQSHGGAVYGYATPSTNFRDGTTAVGLLCRMYTGWKKDHPGIIKGVDLISKKGPSANGTNLYYDYYAAQVLRQFGGPKWDEFNVKLRDFLVAKQAQDAGAKGSWHFTDKGHFNEAGRLCQTSFATMILEVYYRHMPLYADAASEEEFPL